MYRFIHPVCELTVKPEADNSLVICARRFSNVRSERFFLMMMSDTVLLVSCTSSWTWTWSLIKLMISRLSRSDCKVTNSYCYPFMHVIVWPFNSHWLRCICLPMSQLWHWKIAECSCLVCTQLCRCWSFLNGIALLELASRDHQDNLWNGMSNSLMTDMITRHTVRSAADGVYSYPAFYLRTRNYSSLWLCSLHMDTNLVLTTVWPTQALINSISLA